MNRTIEKIEINGCPVELIFAAGVSDDPLSADGLCMGWKVIIDGKQYGGEFSIEKVTRENRDYLINHATSAIKAIKAGA